MSGCKQRRVATIREVGFLMNTSASDILPVPRFEQVVAERALGRYSLDNPEDVLRGDRK